MGKLVSFYLGDVLIGKGQVGPGRNNYLLSNKQADLLQKTLNFVRTQPGATTIDVARKLKVSSAVAVDALHKLMADGLVERRLGKRLYQYYVAGDTPPKIVV